MENTQTLPLEPLKEAFLIKVPNVEKDQAYQELILPHYEFYTILVENYDMALVEGKKIIKEKGIHGVILCAGFSTIEFGDLAKAFGPEVGVFLASGDTGSNAVVSKAISNAKW